MKSQIQKYLKPLWVCKTLHLFITKILATVRDHIIHHRFLDLDNVDQINVEAATAIHVGDDEKADKSGANAVGINCW